MDLTEITVDTQVKSILICVYIQFIYSSDEIYSEPCITLCTTKDDSTLSRSSNHMIFLTQVDAQ